MTFTLGKIKPNVPHAEVALWDTIPLLSSLMDDAAFLARLNRDLRAVVHAVGRDMDDARAEGLLAWRVRQRVDKALIEPPLPG